MQIALRQRHADRYDTKLSINTNYILYLENWPIFLRLVLGGGQVL